MDLLCFVILAPSEHLFNYAHSLIRGATMLFVLVSTYDEMATAHFTRSLVCFFNKHCNCNRIDCRIWVRILLDVFQPRVRLHEGFAKALHRRRIGHRFVRKTSAIACKECSEYVGGISVLN